MVQNCLISPRYYVCNDVIFIHVSNVTCNAVRKTLAGEGSCRVHLLHDGEETVAQVGLAAGRGGGAGLAHEGAPDVSPVTVHKQRRNQDGQQQVTWRNHLICNNIHII